MTPDEVVLTVEDLPTLRRLAKLTRKIADEGKAEEFPYLADRVKAEFADRYTASFIERLVAELEKYELPT